MTRNWVAVASADHVAIGRRDGFMQVCHGKPGPLSRVQPGDLVAYYSPRDQMRGGAARQAFTALGRVCDGAPYQVTMAPGFHPFRRDVAWFATRDAPIRPLLDRLSWGGPNWGYRLRSGLFEVPDSDMDLIATAMATVKAHAS
jgi:hypothetical protein